MYTNKYPRITKDTSLKELRKIHKRIWTYMMIFGHKADTPYTADCVLCQYTAVISDNPTSCVFCPAIWSNKYCWVAGSEFSRFKEYYTLSLKNPLSLTYSILKRYYAWRIRNIPFNTIISTKNDDG